jgi:hypothetical protein
MVVCRRSLCSMTCTCGEERKDRFGVATLFVAGVQAAICAIRSVEHKLGSRLSAAVGVLDAMDALTSGMCYAGRYDVICHGVACHAMSPWKPCIQASVDIGLGPGGRDGVESLPGQLVQRPDPDASFLCVA